MTTLFVRELGWYSNLSSEGLADNYAGSLIPRVVFGISLVGVSLVGVSFVGVSLVGVSFVGVYLV